MGYQMKLRNLLVSASLAALMTGIAPLAHAQTATSVTFFSYALIDLDLNDGITPSLTMSNFHTWITAADYPRPLGSDHLINYSGDPGTINLTTPFGEATATAGANAVSSNAISTANRHLLEGSAFAAWDFVMTPNTSVVFTAIGSVDAKGVGASGAATLFGALRTGTRPEFNQEMLVDNDFQTRQLSFSFSSSVDGANGVVGMSAATDALPVPEPETYAMLLAGLGLIGACAHRRRQA
jgi:hypothetical protein